MNLALRQKLPRLALVAGGLGAGILIAPGLAALLLAPGPGTARPSLQDPVDAGAARFLDGLAHAREGRWDEARRAFTDAEAAGVPEAREHRASLDRRTAAAATAAMSREAASAAAGPIAGEARGLRPTESGAADPVARARAAFRAGRLADATAALSSCRSARCRRWAGELAVVEVGLGADGSTGRPDVDSLERASSATRRLGGSPPIEKAIGAALGPWYHAAGVEALRRGDLALARERFDRALAVLPGHPPSEAERARLRERAREVFLAGYTEKAASPDEARQKFRLVATITAPDEELHRKALGWLERLAGDATSSAGAP